MTYDFGGWRSSGRVAVIALAETAIETLKRGHAVTRDAWPRWHTDAAS